MCGIMGYIGKKQAAPILITGLRRMEYRGYDSAGIATYEKNGISATKKQGQLQNLSSEIDPAKHKGVVGIGHTRWATHGSPSDTNAHPHTVGKTTLIHNGIFENYLDHKSRLTEYTFLSQTDSEVLAALVDSHYKRSGDPLDATTAALRQVRGTFGVIVMFDDQPETLVVARRSSPILIAQDGDSVFVASDQLALAGRASQAIVLGDDEIALCKPGVVEVSSLAGELSPTLTIELQASEMTGTTEGYDHFMQKEIHEQPESVARALSGRLYHARGSSQLGGLNLSAKQLRGVRSIILIGCGTAYHAGLVAKYILEPILGLPISVEIASELRYRNTAYTGHELAIAISQSGETADTIACIDELKLKGIPTLGVVNVVGSTIARMVDGGVYTHAGPEVSVASTKAFTSQITVLLLIGLYMARQRSMSIHEGNKMIAELETIPTLISETLALEPQIKKLAIKLKNKPYLMALGRDVLSPIALETALKVTEISYIPTFGIASGEMKHGPIALLKPEMGVIYYLGSGDLHEKSRSNLAECLARDADTITISDNPSDKNVDLLVPTSTHLQQPFVFGIVGQLLSYHIAQALGREIDKPRNLAKSVTVE